MSQKVKQYARVYLIALVFSTFSYALLMFPVIGIMKGIIGGCLFGLLLTTLLFIVSVPIDYLKKRKYPAEAFNVYQRFCITLPISREEAFNLCEEGLNRYVRIKKVIAIKEKGEINAQTKMSALTFGEYIHIHLDCPSSEEAVLCIESKPVLKYALLDYGRNYENIVYLKGYLGGNLNPRGVGVGIEM